LSRETTFERDLHAVHDRELLSALFSRLCRQVEADLQRKGYAGRTIGIKITYDNFEKVTRDITIDHAVSDAASIRRHAGQCLKRVDLSRRFRLLGVRVGKLVRPGETPVVLQTQEPEPNDLFSSLDVRPEDAYGANSAKIPNSAKPAN
jgi:DNA polymerase-4